MPPRAQAACGQGGLHRGAAESNSGEGGMKLMEQPYVIREENAAQVVKWLRERGGICVWESINLSNPGVTWLTPALQENGAPTPKPTWQAASMPARHITSMDDILVSRDIEHKRFRVGVRPGSQ